MMIVLELLAFRVPALRAYFAAVLKFMYDADVLSEKTILRWESHTLKHRFSCLTEKFVKELKEAAEPMIVWLNEAPVSGEEEEEDEDEDEKPIYNPLNLPLGWDGKPIPYWLYKQYGLDKEYKCEICGNQSYWGRRAFDMHFQEWRHHNGMRCLGIPNTKHFHDITKIEDAKNRRNDGCVTCSVCKD